MSSNTLRTLPKESLLQMGAQLFNACDLSGSADMKTVQRVIDQLDGLTPECRIISLCRFLRSVAHVPHVPLLTYCSPMFIHRMQYLHEPRVRVICSVICATRGVDFVCAQPALSRAR